MIVNDIQWQMTHNLSPHKRGSRNQKYAQNSLPSVPIIDFILLLVFWAPKNEQKMAKVFLMSVETKCAETSMGNLRMGSEVLLVIHTERPTLEIGYLQ